MKKITQISKQQHSNRYNLFVNDCYYCSITEETLVNLQLKKDKVLDEALLKQLIIEEKQNKCLNDALYLLGQRSYFEKALGEKLKQKNNEEEVVETVISKLKDKGYLSDDILTESFIRDKKHLSKKGPRAIANALYAKGVHTNTIKQALEEQYTKEEELENCRALLEKRLEHYQKRYSDPYTLKAKLYAFLAQRGYSSTVIQQVIESTLNR